MKLIVRLEPSPNADFYDVKTTTPIRSDQFKNKKALWERTGPSTSFVETNSLNPWDQSKGNIGWELDQNKLLARRSERSTDRLADIWADASSAPPPTATIIENVSGVQEIANEVEEQGPFGPILRGYEGRWREAALELERRQDGDAIGALHHKDVGPIDLVWGKEGNDRSDGWLGEAHCMAPGGPA